MRLTRWLVSLILALALSFSPALAAGLSSFQLPATTTAYAAGQLIANSATGASVVPPSFALSPLTGPQVLISRAHIYITDTTAGSWNGQTITLYLWTPTAPTFTTGDRTTYLPATGTQSFLGTLTCTMGAVNGDGTDGECATTIGNVLTITAPNPTTIYWTPVATTGSGTTGASATISLTPEILN